MTYSRILVAPASLVVVALGGCVRGAGPPPFVPRDDPAVLVGEGEGESDDGDSARWFDAPVIAHVSIMLADAARDALDAEPLEWTHGDLRVELADGAEPAVIELRDVGVRLKGEGNLLPLGRKASFKVKTDKWVDEQRVLGLSRLTLNGMVEDPSCVAEALAYAAFRDAGLPAPRTSYVTVDVNGEDYGLYVNVESEDKQFLKRWFDDNEGNLYEENGADWLPGNESEFEKETNEDEGAADLTALFAAIEAANDATLLDDVSGVLDVEHFLRFAAWEALVNQWDGYAYTRFGPNNYRLYDDPSSGRFVLLPWGMDMAMKPLDGVAYVDPFDASGALLARCVSISSCRAQFAEVLAAEAARLADMDLAARADDLYELVHAARASDPMAESDMRAFEDMFDHVRAYTQDRPQVVLNAL